MNKRTITVELPGDEYLMLLGLLQAVACGPEFSHVPEVQEVAQGLIKRLRSEMGLAPEQAP